MAVRRIDRDIDSAGGVQWVRDATPVPTFAKTHRLFTPKSDASLQRLTRGDILLPAAERTTLKAIRPHPH